MKVILASSSPRRKEILNLIGLKNFETVSPKVKEIPVSMPHDVVKNALKKAKWVFNEIKPKGETLIIASDTAVSVNGRFLGKPKNEEEARKMLQTLRGRWHNVYTAISVIYSKPRKRVIKYQLDRARVFFKHISDDEIEWYIQTGEPLDKAGAYGIQGYGALFVERIVGDYFTVMGMSPSVLYEILRDILGTYRTLELLKPPSKQNISND